MLDLENLPRHSLEWRRPKSRTPTPAPLPEAPTNILQALGKAGDHDGRKWHLLGGFGGLLRSAGFSQEYCASLVSAWLEGTNADVQNAITRACGAWDKEPWEVSGEQALAEFIGEDHAALVARVIDENAWPRGKRLAHAAKVEAARARVPVTAVDDSADWDWSRPDVPLEYACRGLCIAPSERKVTLLAGEPGASKGPFAAHLAAAFAFGKPVLHEHPAEECRVGILDYEGARLTSKRVREHARGFGERAEDLTGRVFLRGVEPGTDLRWIGDWCHERDVRVLVIDSYTSAMLTSGVDPNSPEYAQFAAALGSLDLCVIVVAHARKVARKERGEQPALGDVAGSYALAGMAQTAIGLWRPDPDDALHVSVGCLRAPEEPFKRFELRWECEERDGEGDAWTGRVVRRIDDKHATAEEDERLTGLCARVLSAYAHELARPLSLPKIVELAAVKREDAIAALYALDAGGVIKRLHQGHQTLSRVVVDARGRVPDVRVVGGKAVPVGAPTGTGRFTR